ncbi:MAG: TonB-dependent receptor [Bacteroidia bacterium]|nr:TonB-dependent receptor [Bacteroidia bacterium]
MRRHWKYWFGVLFSIVYINVYAQTTFSGKVSNEFGESITGANIYIDGTFDGTSSDQNGQFTFSTSALDSVILVASFIGYETFRNSLVVKGEPIKLDIILIESSSHLGEIVISAGSYVSGSDSKSEILRPLDIVTTAGVTADVPGALNTLPGTQTVGEVGRLFVRGGDSYETTTFIDGMVVLESYDQQTPNLPTRSRFSPFMFSGTSFSTGGYSAEYGQGLSSALILNTRDVSPQTRTDLSIMSVGLEAAHSHVGKNASFSGKVGYIDLDPYYKIIRQDFDWIDPPTAIDGNIAYRRNVGKDGLFKVYGKVNISGMQLNVDEFQTGESPMAVDMSNDYLHINTTYKDFLSDKWVLRTGVSYTLSKEDILPGPAVVQYKTAGLHVKSVGEYQHNTKVFLRFGGEVINTNHSEDFYDAETEINNRFDFDQTIISIFAETELYLTNALLARLGARAEYNTLNDEYSIDPRVSMAYKTGEYSQFSAAFGLFRQSPTNDLLRVSNQLEPERALHYIASYQLIKSNRTFRIEAYWKEYLDLVTFDAERFYDPLAYANEGSGYARGFDVFYRDSKSIKNADFWLSYSLLDTERLYRKFPEQAVPAYASRHNFSFVYKHFVPVLKSQIGLTYTYASGRTYNDPNATEFNNGKTPMYADMSLNVSYLPKPNVIVYLSVTNVFERDHIFGYAFKNERNDEGIYEGRPVMLPAPRFLFMGVFITFSKGGTTSQLPQL